MLKTKLWSTSKGQEKFTTYQLTKHNVGNATEWWSISYHTADGKSLKNKWGGYANRNCGQPAYIQKVWNTL